MSISYIRIAIFVLALVFLALFLIVMNRTRLGLEVRAVTQNPRMAASMGINPDKINMLTFGFGSGIAGIAGVAIGLYAKVTSEMGQDYIVQSFMTVVVGGVGNVWGTLAGATLIGVFQVNTWIGVLAATGVILSAGYALWLYRRVVMGDLIKESLRTISDMTTRERAIFAPLVAMTLLLGVYPSLVLDVTGPSVAALLDSYHASLPADAAGLRLASH